MYCSNHAMIEIAHDSGYKGRAKHIELRFLGVQDVVTHQNIDVKYCPLGGGKLSRCTYKIPSAAPHAKGGLLLILAESQ